MVLVGLPYTEPALTATTSGGTPYGASHTAGASASGVQLTGTESELARALGARVATLASRLRAGS
jgi:NAD(P)H dehydrogenase (quinone)